MDNELLTQKIEALAEEYASRLNAKIAERKEEMKQDDTSHYLIYRVLGVSSEDGQLIDEYQNTGRFLYKYAGSFLEEAASLCLAFKNSEGQKTRVENNQGQGAQARKIQETLKTIYAGVNGEYYAGDDAWAYIQEYSGYDLKAILTVIANKKTLNEG